MYHLQVSGLPHPASHVRPSSAYPSVHSPSRWIQRLLNSLSIQFSGVITVASSVIFISDGPNALQPMQRRLQQQQHTRRPLRRKEFRIQSASQSPLIPSWLCVCAWVYVCMYVCACIRASVCYTWTMKAPLSLILVLLLFFLLLLPAP